MTFLNWSILVALAAVAVPIAIHLLNRRSAKVVDWGAMHFLLGSLVSRKRRVLLEEVLLLALRCLLVALIVLAVARPIVLSGSSPLWVLVLLAALLGAVALGAGTALWQSKRWRRAMFAAGAGLLGLALLAVILAQVFGAGALTGGSRDVALVIDASASMGLEVEGKSNFSRAVAEARDLVKALGRSATVSVILAGPVPELKTPFPLTDPDRINAVLDGLEPTGGVFAVHDAVQAASMSLSSSSNVGKQIVLVTDGQSTGWDVDDRARWSITANELKTAHVAEPQLYCRTMTMPDRLRNLGVTELVCARKVVGTDRALPIQVRVANTGQAPVGASSAYLFVDGKQVDQRPVTQLQPNASETLGFSHRFDAPGFHVIEVRADVDDDLPGDNRQSYAVRVLDRLPVLIVDGHSARRVLDRASAFIQLGLDPGSLVGGPPQGRGGRGFVEVTVVEVVRLGEVADLGKFRAVILADVPQLPKAVAARLADYVADGGGLLVAPGGRASPVFYNAWPGPGPGPSRLMPATLGRRVVAGEKDPARVAVETLTHPALASFIEAGKTDLDSALLTAYWLLEVDPKSRSVVTGGRLSGGAPWLVDQQAGQGRVLMTAAALDVGDGNLPTRRSFLPLLHGLVYHLADTTPSELNLRPARELVLRVAADAVQPAAPGPPGAPAPVLAPGPRRFEVVAPDGSPRDAIGQVEKKALVVKVDRASFPGLYRVKLPRELAPSGASAIPFVVIPDARESNLKRLSDGEFETLRNSVKLRRLHSREDLLAIASGRPPGQGLGKYLALAALLLVLGEVALTRWIALQRQSTTAQPVDLATLTGPASGFAEQLAMMRAAQDGREPAQPDATAVGS